MSDQEAWSALLRLFWHPVIRVEDIDDGRQVAAARLLGNDLAVAKLGPERWAAYTDRCPHRSTRLSIGSVDDGGLRCAYHGWRFAADGRCDDIPSMPGAPIPAAACATGFRTVERYGLIWVLLDPRLDPPIPACPMHGDDELRVMTPAPYDWPVGASRRVENFVDLAHFAFVHDGTLGRRDEPVPLLPEITRADGELRFFYEPPEVDTEPSAMFGGSAYRMPMPLTVNIEFFMENARRMLWMTASPIDVGVTRSFWMMGRSDDLDPAADEQHLAFQQLVLDEDEPVVSNQSPAEMDLRPGAELSVKTDRVSIAYRRWLSAMVESTELSEHGTLTDDGVARLRTVLEVTDPTDQSSSGPRQTSATPVPG